MLSKLSAFARRFDMIQPGDRIVAAVSGGADSVALLFCLYLLRDTVDFTLEAAHFNHHLRGSESDRDEAFVRQFCDRYEIPLHVGHGQIVAGEKGLEAAAREARYAFLQSLPGKIATAHTADDNAETILMRLIRGTGLKGLGAIAPVNGRLIRPMLTCTRQDVEDFLQEYYLPHVEDSSNQGDDFLRNRIRHHVMPLLKGENPRLSENLTAMALKLRLDEDCLTQEASGECPDVETLRKLHPAIRRRYLERFLKENGVREPEEVHIVQLEELVFHRNPSVSVHYPGGVRIGREYNRLAVHHRQNAWESVELPCPGRVDLPTAHVRVICEPASELGKTYDSFPVSASGKLMVRSRLPGDSIRLSGGTKSLKKLFIDRKIPAMHRDCIPVVCDEKGILGVFGFGANLDRLADGLPAVRIRFERI